MYRGVELVSLALWLLKASEQGGLGQANPVEIGEGMIDWMCASARG